MEFIIETNPQGKARARTFYDKRASKMRSITPDKTRAYENLVRWSYAAAGGEYYGDRLIRVEIKAYHPIPKSYSKKKREECLNSRPTTKPDADNCAKAILDALNGVAWHDDSQVVSLSVDKFYGDFGRVVVAINPM